MEKEGFTQEVEFNNTSLQILKYLTQFITIKKISKYVKISRTATYKHINKLLEKELIRRIGNSYEVTEQGLHTINKYSTGLIRLHNLAFKLTILNKPNNWELKRTKIAEIRSFSKQIELNNNSYEIHNFSNIKIKTTNNSIIFYMPSFYGKDTDDCFKQALDSLFRVIPKVESIFKIVLIKDRKANIEIISSHYAKLQDSLAKLYKAENNKLYVKDESGNIWLIADYSFRVNELETIYNKTAKEDMDIVQGFLNDLRKNPINQSQLMGMIGQVTANQLIFAENMKSHINAIQTLSKEVKRLSKVFKSTLTENTKLKLGTQKTLFEYE